METDEAKKISAIAITADGGCASCVNGLFDKLKFSFPSLPWDDYKMEALTHANRLNEINNDLTEWDGTAEDAALDPWKTFP